MNTSIYDKTAKGREEIATRRHHLAPRLRTLLVMVDGRRSQQELLKNVEGLGLTADSMSELLAQGHIVLATSLGGIEAPVELPAPEPEPYAIAALAGAVAPAQVQQFQALYDFYNKTIKSTIGLRGFTLQLKVEKAASVDDFRALRRPYLEAVLKAKGDDIARHLGEQLDQLLQS